MLDSSRKLGMATGRILVALIALGLAPQITISAQIGSVDPSFNSSGGPNAQVLAAAPQPDQKMIIGGDFTTIGTASRARIARLNHGPRQGGWNEV